MATEEIVGRSKDIVETYGRAGCGLLGKLVSYPGGRYEEVGDVYLDITSPHCMLIVGKRGTGKSYTLGVLAESFATLEPKYRSKIAVLLIDTMSVFHSLKTPNTDQGEVLALKRYGLKPQDFEAMVKIFVPAITLKRLADDGRSMHYDQKLALPLSEADTYDWLNLFGLSQIGPVGTLLTRVMQEVKKTPNYGFKDLFAAIETLGADQTSKEALANLFRTVKDLGVFSQTGTPYGELVKGGQISVLDISYLGRLGGYDLRNLIIAIIGRKLLTDRTLYTTMQMQAQANLIEDSFEGNLTQSHPLVYMLLDEAHLFLPSCGKTLSSDILIDWIKLGRHPGLSLIMATQEPSALHESAIRQSDILIAHNVTSNDDITALGKAKQSFMKGDKNIQDLVSTMEHKRGLAVLFDDKTRTVELCKVRPRLTLHTGIDATAM